MFWETIKKMKYKLFYGYGLDTTKMECIGEYASIEECERKIHSYIKENNFESYYFRVTKQDDSFVWYDYGSWTKFFAIKKSQD